jgi:hypothetical protein
MFFVARKKRVLGSAITLPSGIKLEWNGKGWRKIKPTTDLSGLAKKDLSNVSESIIAGLKNPILVWNGVNATSINASGFLKTNKVYMVATSNETFYLFNAVSGNRECWSNRPEFQSSSNANKVPRTRKVSITKRWFGSRRHRYSIEYITISEYNLFEDNRVSSSSATVSTFDKIKEIWEL